MAKDIKKIAHPSYLTMMNAYAQIRDCFEGEEAIKKKGEVYLPRLSAQTQQDYDNYRRRALFFPITGKTCSSMVGMATTKPPKVTYPDTMKRYFVDTEQNYQFTEFYVNIFNEVILMGKYGVLMDAPISNDQTASINLVPYIAENIINWDQDDRTGQLTMLLLREHVQVAVEGEPFESKIQCQFRHCFLNPAGVYMVEVLDEDLKPIISKPLVAPVFAGQTIDFIPWTPFGASGVHINPDKPPMQDISSINISHYMTSADLEWGRHIVGLPTPVVSGVDSGTNLKIGGTSAWVLPVVEAKAYYLEFLGQGLQSLEKAMTEKVGLMATISARLVDNSTRGSEAAETVRLRYMSESASLIHIIGSVENGCNMMYTMLAKLLRDTGTVTVKFSKEILGVGITFKDLAVMFEAYLNGSLSKESLVYNLRRLDALDPNRTDEQELQAIRPPPPAIDPNKKPAANTQE